MSKLFFFNQELALQYGVDEAIMLHNFIFWIGKNKDTHHNYRDGRIWTYQSNVELAERFPFWTEKQLRRIVDSCVKQDVILKGNYNKIGYDKTTWYALKDEALLDSYSDDDVTPIVTSSAHLGESKSPNGQIECPRRADLYQIVPQIVPQLPPPDFALRKITGNKNSEDDKRGCDKSRKESTGEDNEKDYVAIKLKLKRQYEELKTDPKHSHLRSTS